MSTREQEKEWHGFEPETWKMAIGMNDYQIAEMIVKDRSKTNEINLLTKAYRELESQLAAERQSRERAEQERDAERQRAERLFNALAWIAHDADTAQQMRDRALRVVVESYPKQEKQA